jgi:ribulose-bisphosphate carboxylase large chain
VSGAEEARAEVSGERLTAVYRLTGSEGEAREAALAIAVEQSVEFPRHLLPPGNIEQDVVGRLEALDRRAHGVWRATLSFAVENTAFELTQLLNALYGNASLLPGVRLERFDLPPSLYDRLPGPRFGPDGLRQRLAVARRPLVATALKPMGLDAEALALRAGQLASSGIDLVKDDHGLSDQPYAPWRERVARAAAAVAEASERGGHTTLYLPNVTAPADQVLERAHAAKALGAGGVLVSPGITGFDAMRLLAADADLGLPVMAHPALLGSYVLAEGQGFSFEALFGEVMRLAGADAVIFPNYGGRFSLAPASCRAIADALAAPLGPLPSALPVPAGGMTVDRVPEMVAFYGVDVVLLIGGDLFADGPDPSGRARRLVERVAAEAVDGLPA